MFGLSTELITKGGLATVIKYKEMRVLTVRVLALRESELFALTKG